MALRTRVLGTLLAPAMLIATLTVPAAAQQPAPRAGDDEVVGKVGGAEVKLGLVREFLKNADPAVRQQAEKDPSILYRLVRAELERLAVINEAREKKWDQRPEVKQAIERARDQVIVGSYLQSVVTLPPNFPSDAEVQAAYEVNKGNLMKQPEFRLAQIFLAVSPSADKGVTDAVQRRAEELSKRARTKGTDFAALARESSDDKESAINGGDSGWQQAANLRPEIRNVVAAMAKNEVSAPIRSAAGYHVVKLVVTKPAVQASLAEVREGLVGTLRQRRFEELQAAHVGQMLERGGLAINEMALRRALQP
jgi:peptidylprolyl isomerase